MLSMIIRNSIKCAIKKEGLKEEFHKSEKKIGTYGIYQWRGVIRKLVIALPPVFLSSKFLAVEQQFSTIKLYDNYL